MSGVLARVVAALFVVACAMPASAAPKITLLVAHGANNLGAYVAKDRGFFDKHGLDVDATPTPNGSLISARWWPTRRRRSCRRRRWRRP